MVLIAVLVVLDGFSMGFVSGFGWFLSSLVPFVEMGCGHPVVLFGRCFWVFNEVLTFCRSSMPFCVFFVFVFRAVLKMRFFQCDFDVLISEGVLKSKAFCFVFQEFYQVPKFTDCYYMRLIFGREVCFILRCCFSGPRRTGSRIQVRGSFTSLALACFSSCALTSLGGPEMVDGWELP